MLVRNVLSKQAGWSMELNFSPKLLCFMLSQDLQMLILKCYFHAKDKKCPTATSSGQAGKMSPFFPLGISRVGHASKSSLLGHVIIHYFIDQACSFKMAEYWPHSVLHFYWPRPGCALWPVAPASVTFVLGRLENLCFFTEIICWAHWISQVQSAGLPSIFLRAQPCKRKAGSIKAQIFSHLNLTPGQ